MNGAHKAQPEKRSNRAIPNAPAAAPVFLPKIIAVRKSGTFPRCIRPPFAAMGSLIFTNPVARNTRAMDRPFIAAFLAGDTVAQLFI